MVILCIKQNVIELWLGLLALALYVEKKEGEYAHLSHNHPLAGQTLIFDIEIVRVRAALPEEIAYGHPHGIDGTQGHP